MDKSQIITHSSAPLSHTAYDVKWVPQTARFALLGQKPAGSGVLTVYGLSEGALEIKATIEKPHSFKCGTFGASSASNFAVGDFSGRLSMFDLASKSQDPIWSTSAHSEIINCIDGVAGKSNKCGPPELATGSRDGAIKIWDVRQPQSAVATMAPKEGDPKIDAWAVAFGDSHDNSERCICAGYENGDVKMFDLRKMETIWQTNVRNGVCSVEFDRRDIKMNKLVVTGLESKFHLFDLRTFNEKKGGFARLEHKVADNSTVWCVKHLPQNRDIFITSGGAGNLDLFRYKYPTNRVLKGKPDEGGDVGVVGTLERLQTANLAEQPISAFDWSPDKLGLCAFAGFDQRVRVALVTRLDRY